MPNFTFLLLLCFFAFQPTEQSCQPALSECRHELKLASRQQHGHADAIRRGLWPLINKTLSERAEQCRDTLEHDTRASGLHSMQQYHAAQMRRVQRALHALDKAERGEGELAELEHAHRAWKIVGIVFICVTCLLTVALIILLGLRFCNLQGGGYPVV